jgi:hypothetical protein
MGHNLTDIALKGNGEGESGREAADYLIGTTLDDESQQNTTDYNRGEAVQQFANEIQQKTTVWTQPTGFSPPKSW